MTTDRELLQRVADQTLNWAFRYDRDDYAGLDTAALRWARWDWYIGVAFYGVGLAADTLGESSYLPRMKQWVDARIETKIGKLCVNTSSPLTTVLRISQTDPEPRYEALLKRFDAYFKHDLARIENGAFAHTRLLYDHPDQIWADTLFMTVIYLAQRGAATQNKEYLIEAGRQLLWHLECLADPETGLCYHGWNDTTKQRIGAKWGRGNGWILASAVEILTAIGTDFPERAAILAILRRLLASLENLQTPEGFWRTVIDAGETYPETSVTAGVAFGVLKGIRLGYFDPSFQAIALRALTALRTQVDQEGNVQGGSSGTPVLETMAQYNEIAQSISPYTQGLALMALSEAL